MKAVSVALGKMGRPCGFDADAALKIFWTMGYEGITVADLPNAM